MHRSSLASVTALAILLIGPTSRAEDVTYEPGAYIVDMGNATNNASTAKGLLGYGFVYDAVRNRQAPVDWIIKPGKTSQGETDFVGPGNKSYSSSAFIVSKDYAELVTTLVATYRGQGAVIDGPTTSSFVAPRYATLRSVPNILLDTQNGPIVEDYLNNGGITDASNIYRFGQPTALDACDDVFALPHADPTWSAHGNLVAFNTTFKGFIWGACHAVSVLENIDSPDADTVTDMNFLAEANAGGQALVPYGSHDDGVGPYSYSASEWSNPFMQYLGDLGPATDNGSEQVFMPALGSAWRDTTTVAVWDPDQGDVPAKSPGPAAKLAWGRGFGDPDNGMVMYVGGHDHDRASGGANVAAQRLFFNFLLQAGVEKVIATDINVTLGTTACSGSVVSLTAEASGGTDTFDYAWSSSCGGTFSSATSQSTEWTIPADLANGTTCFLKAIVTDGCDRFAFQTVPVRVGDPKADLSITVDASPGTVFPDDLLTFTFVAHNAGPETVTDAVVDIALPAGASFLDASTPAYDDATKRWTIGALAAGGGATLTIRTTIAGAPSGTAYEATATIDATSSLACSGKLSDPDLSNNTDSALAVSGGECIGAADCDDGDPCSADDCAAGECVNTAVVVDDGDPCTEDACDPATGLVTHVGAPNCCTVEADCPGGACDVEARECVACLDDAPPGEVDTGCTVGVSVCDLTGTGCVECNVDADCEDSGEVCDGATRKCVPCHDSASFPEVDAGCEAGAPVCVDQGSFAGGGGGITVRTCVVCAGDTTPDALVDEGCHGGAPICDLSVPGGRCVACDDGADCADGLTCDVEAGVCVACTDDRAPGTIDSGCTEDLPVCALAAADDASPRCLPCEDNQGAGLQDWGCDAAARFCVADGLAGPSCHECESDDDCGAEQTCDEGGCRDPITVDAVDDRYVTGEGSALTIESPAEGVAGNDVYPAEGGFTVTPIAGGAPTAEEGVLDLHDDGTFTFTPASGFAGTVVFSYQLASEVDGASDEADVTIVVEGRPRPHDDAVETDEDTALSFDPRDNDSDPNGGPLTIARLVTPPAHGEATVGERATITYTPSPDYAGPDALVYELCDATDRCASASVAITVLPVNDAPHAEDDRASTMVGAAVAIPVLANDRDIDGDPLALARIATAPAVGVAVVDDDVITYTPGDGEYVAVFAYEVCDPGGLCAVGQVTVTVSANRPPLALGESVVTAEDTSVLIVVLANDTDPEGDALHVDGVAVPARHGAVSIDEAGDALYTPASDYNGRDVFSYRVCDAGGACSTAIVSVDVTPVNDAPRANDDFSAVPAESSSVLRVTQNDSDPDGDPLAVSRIVAAPALGQVTLGPDGTLTYESGAEAGTDTFDYEVCDELGACDVARVTVYVGTGNRDPVPLDDQASTTTGQPVTIDVLANDGDPDGDPLDLGAVEDPARGTATAVGGKVVYVSDADHVGDEVFFYTVCDPAGACATAFVEVEVTTGDNRAPVAVDDTAYTRESSPVTFDATANDFDADGDPLAVTALGPPAHGSATLEPDGLVTYVPADGFSGEDVFAVTIGDGRGGAAMSTALVIVAPGANRPPDAVDDDFGDVPGDEPSILAVLDNDSDLDGDPLMVLEVVQPQHGSAQITADHQILYTPLADYIGPDHFTYTINDGFGGRDTATVSVYVGDRDRDGLGDVWERTVTLTDPDNADTDGDGLRDDDEVGGGEDPLRHEPGLESDPLDADTDDDGLGDGDETRGTGPLAGFGATDPLDDDSDDDGIADGVEVGVTEPVPGGTSNGFAFDGTEVGVWIPDADPSTTTDPRDDDSDDDGLTDGSEDLDGNGRWDGEVGATGTIGSGETDPNAADTDGDGIQDGAELGLTAPEGTGTDASRFVPASDPTAISDPRDSDSDDDGTTDAEEVTGEDDPDGPDDPDTPDGPDGPGPGPGPDDPTTRSGSNDGGCQGGPAALPGLLALVLLVVLRRRRESRR